MLGIVCLLPLVQLFATSLSAGHAVDAGLVKLWPVGFNIDSYLYAANNPEFVRSLWISVQRMVLGVSFSLLLVILAAYPLSKESENFSFRTVYVWLIVITMLFSAGLVPNYMLIRDLGMLDTIWALIFPKSVALLAFNVVLLLNFFRGLPKELEEAAFMDGAGHWRMLWQIYLPLSKPALATIFLLISIDHWNSWFDGILFMNTPDHYPLSSYLRTVILQNVLDLSVEEMARLQNISNSTNQAAQVFLGALPILAVYPFLQRHFAKGIVLGSVKE
jgi:putative aldouronate transport system permease protein